MWVKSLIKLQNWFNLPAMQDVALYGSLIKKKNNKLEDISDFAKQGALMSFPIFFFFGWVPSLNDLRKAFKE